MKEKFDNFDINDRILLIMKGKNLNKNSLSKTIGFSQPALTKIEKHTNLPSFKLLFELLRVFPDVDAKWLLTGEGEMLHNEGAEMITPAIHSNISVHDELISVLKRNLEDKEEIIALQKKHIDALKENRKLRSPFVGDQSGVAKKGAGVRKRAAR
jgi:DNA-binding XRE family transcriptional regulator